MKDKNLTRLGVFLLFTFVVTWSLEFLLLANRGFDHPMAQFAMMVFLFIPGIANLFTRKFTGEGFKNMGIRPNIHGNIHWYVFAWLGTIVAVYVGCGAYFSLNLNVFDSDMSYYTEAYVEMYKTHGQNYTTAEIYKALRGQLVTGAFLMPLFSFPKSLMMELGFRGYMMPKLYDKYNTTVAMVIGGVIWGLWFAPLMIMGWIYGTDYPLFPFLGLIAILLFSVIVGVIAAFLALKTKSCIPSAILFATIEGYGTVGMYFCNKEMSELNQFMGPTAYGVLGGAGLLLMAVICLIIMNRDLKKETL